MRQGFLSGSDDYMVKPVNVNEMVLRVGAVSYTHLDVYKRQVLELVLYLSRCIQKELSLVGIRALQMGSLKPQM